MRWSKLDRKIPWVPSAAAPLHARETVVATSSATEVIVRVRQPGVHAGETKEIVSGVLAPRFGGDFVVEIHDPKQGWVDRQFRHKDLFADIGVKTQANHGVSRNELAPALVAVVAEGADPMQHLMTIRLPGLHTGALLVAAQCLALCEHRRYPQYEPVGGRALPARFALGIIWGRWSPGEASRVEHKGQQGLHWLRSEYGWEPSFSTVLGRPLSNPACREERDR